MRAGATGRVMASKRGQASARREPVFDSGPDLRVAADDRPAPSTDEKPRAKPRKRRARKKRPARSKHPLIGRIGRIAYWGLVACLWLAIGGVGVVAWVGAHLPPIQSLEIPKRPPSIQIVDMQGRALARRGDLAGEPLPLKEMPSYVPKAFIAIEDRRFYEHHGVDPFGIGRAFVANVLHRPSPRAAPPSASSLPRIFF